LLGGIMKKIFKHKIIIILALILIFAFTGCNSEGKNEVVNNSKISSSEFLLDTHVNITLYGTEDESIFKKIFEEIERLENILSVHIEGSDLDLLKDNAGIKPVKVNEDTIKIIEKSIEYSKLTDGLFDITAGPLIKLWGIGTESAKIPTEDEINEAVNLINYKKIQIDKNNSTVFLEDKGMIADLGAIAKGYIADKVEEKLYELGVESAIINLGGNVQLIGAKPDGSLFRIGIQDPDESRGGNIGIYTGRDVTIVSSGDYERFFIEDGVRYHHILNPETGYPAREGIISSTVISNNSSYADALSTSFYILGIEKSFEIAKSMEDINIVLVTEDNKAYVSKELKDRIRLTTEELEVIYR